MILLLRIGGNIELIKPKKVTVDKDGFLKLSMQDCIWYCWGRYRSGEWNADQYEKAMRVWWRANHGVDNPDLLSDVLDVFDISPPDGN